MTTNLRDRDLKGLRVLVTGAGGFIGASLVRALVAAGAEVTAMSRRPGRLQTEAAPYRFVSCDLRALDALTDALAACRPELVYHLAAQPDAAEDGVQMQRTIEHNIGGTANLLRALRPFKDCGLIYGDSVKVYGDGPVPYRAAQTVEPFSSYAVSKVASWGLIDINRRLHDFPAMALRPTLVYGLGQGFNLFTFLIQSIQAGREQILLDGGAQSRDPLYVDDAVAAFLQAGRRLHVCNGMTIPLGGGRETSVAELARLAVSLLGGTSRIVLRPTAQRPTDMMRSWCDNAEAQEWLGWSPVVSLEQGILLTAGSMASQPASVPTLTG